MAGTKGITYIRSKTQGPIGMALWRTARSALTKRQYFSFSHARAFSTEVEGEMQSPLFTTPDASVLDDPATFGSSIRDQTNFYVKQVLLFFLLHASLAWERQARILVPMQSVLQDKEFGGISIVAVTIFSRKLTLFCAGLGGVGFP